jgi:hypothetical protein
MTRYHADEYQRIADNVRQAIADASGPMGSPGGAGQDLESAAEQLSRISPECSGEA